MTDIGEAVAVVLHPPGDETCPFCPGKQEPKWKTYKGADNSSKTLRSVMNKPSNDGYAPQSGARPKDGKENHQSPDSAVPNPDPIHNHGRFGAYSDQAHHCISGNEILKGHAIEQIICKGSDYDGDTGYSVNNAGNGVFLPAYPKDFRGIWGAATFPKTYPLADGESITIRTAADDDIFKFQVMKSAMETTGQAHIGGHEGHFIEDLAAYDKSYPTVIKGRLDEIVRHVVNKSKECPFCTTSTGEPKKPFIPPYRLNQSLDNLSAKIARELTSPPGQWKYFISKFSKAYFTKLKGIKSAKSSLLS